MDRHGRVACDRNTKVKWDGWTDQPRDGRIACDKNGAKRTESKKKTSKVLFDIHVINISGLSYLRKAKNAKKVVIPTDTDQLIV